MFLIILLLYICKLSASFSPVEALPSVATHRPPVLVVLQVLVKRPFFVGVLRKGGRGIDRLLDVDFGLGFRNAVDEVEVLLEAGVS